jgi:hypothetical protein
MLPVTQTTYVGRAMNYPSLERRGERERERTEGGRRHDECSNLYWRFQFANVRVSILEDMKMKERREEKRRGEGIRYTDLSNVLIAMGGQ